MYKIKNMTNGLLMLNDIGVKLKRGETVDLDTMMPREKAESSMNLRVAMSDENQLVAVLHKDVTKPITSLAFDPALFLDMERRIREQITQQMQAAPIVAPPANQSSGEVQQLTEKLSELISKMGNGQGVAPTSVSNDIEYTMDSEKLLDVHAKALKRMTQGASGNVQAKQNTSQSDVSKRANELEDFLK